MFAILHKYFNYIKYIKKKNIFNRVLFKYWNSTNAEWLSLVFIGHESNKRIEYDDILYVRI